MEQYIPAHTYSGCQCGFLSINLEQLISILEKGEVPIVKIDYTNDAADADLRLTLEPRTKTTKYTAISHVWADGFGNPTLNGIHRCQAEKLNLYLRKLGVGPLLWFDTLCIPVERQHANLRNCAMATMASVYAGAEQVLVLDAELMSIYSPTADEAIGRVLCSTWMCRSWTLQEALLAQDCVFRFANTFYVARRTSFHRHTWIQVDRLQTRLPTTCDEDDSLTDELLVKFFGYQQLSSPGSRLVDTWNNLIGRTTTQTGDLYIVIANLVGVDPLELWKMSSEERLPAILLALGTIPFSLLFTRELKSTIPGQPNNLWLPTTVGQDFLFPGIDLKIKDEHLKGYIPDDQYIMDHYLTYVVPKSVHTSLQPFDMWDKEREQLVSISPILQEVQPFAASLQHICVIIEYDFEAPDNARGAIFLVWDWTPGSKLHQLELSFVCTAEVVVHDTASSDSSDGPDEDRVDAVLVNAPCKLRIRYDPIPEAKQLTRLINPATVDSHRMYPAEFGAACVILLGLPTLGGIYYCYRKFMKGDRRYLPGLIVLGLFSPFYILALKWACVIGARNLAPKYYRRKHIRELLRSGLRTAMQRNDNREHPEAEV